ncbi:MAG: SDR family oxidoreductase [Opitutae bacterium]|nr:SDR family oxidoreductase [Opitutae bacterium]MBT5691910.1 SDR family oxidoreductase [Opitutae bacterium]MBT7851943.1 SDR family oxidoreductase [Opitutae bacterium]
MEYKTDLNPSKHLIVGASRGIGMSLIESSLETGEQVVALSRSKPTNIPRNCIWVIGDANEPESYINEIPDKIDKLTFCPGKVILGPIKRLQTEHMLEAYKTNVLDAFTLIKSMLPKVNRGSIVLISSVAASTGLPNHCAISAAKSGLEGFAMALAADLAPNVRVNVVAPTLVPTEMGIGMVGGEKVIPVIENRHPLKRIPAVREISDTVNYLHSSSAISITGQVLKIDAGLSSLRLNER